MVMSDRGAIARSRVRSPTCESRIATARPPRSPAPDRDGAL